MKRRFPFALLALLPLPAFADDTPAQEAAQARHISCVHYSDLAYSLAQKRDQGLSARSQWDYWQTIPDDDPIRAQQLSRVQTVLQYSYGKGSKVTPDQTRAAFMEGCAERNAAYAAPPPAALDSDR